jgi:hypothetical protein
MQSYGYQHCRYAYPTTLFIYLFIYLFIPLFIPDFFNDAFNSLIQEYIL